MSGSCAGNCQTELPLLDGLTEDQLRALYAQIQKAILDIMMGRREVSVQYAQGDGSKSVTYGKGDVTGLNYLLRYIRAALGATCNTRRRAIGVAFP